MKKELSGVAARVFSIIDETVRSVGCELWDVEFVKEGAKHILRVTIDSENGVGIDDCERVHRAIDPLLDAADPIDVSYYLEVSSPGIERELTLARHIEASVGERVEARLFAPQDGRRVFSGVLNGFSSDGKVSITEPGCDTASELPLEAISKMKTVFDFGS